MSVIYHYSLVQDVDIHDIDLPGDELRCSVLVPNGSRLLSIRERQGDIVAYFRVDPEVDEIQKLYFYVVPTGVEFNIFGVPFYDTINVGPLVFHIFCTL